MKNYILAIAAIVPLLFSLPKEMSAQEQADYLIYAQKAGMSSHIFRGRQAVKYPFVHNGTYYWTSPDYKIGSVKYNGKMYWDVLLNIDACQGDLLIKEESGLVEHILSREYVEYFTIGNENYFNLSLCGYDAPQGYFQEIYTGDVKIFKRVEKIYSDKISNGELVGSSIPGFKQGVFKLFSAVVTYYYMKDGEISQIKSKRDLISRYKKDKVRYKAIRRFYRQNEMGQERDFDKYCITMMNFIESGDE